MIVDTFEYEYEYLICYYAEYQHFYQSVLDQIFKNQGTHILLLFLF